MKKLKTIMAAVLTVAVLFSLTACGTENDNLNSEVNSSNSEESKENEQNSENNSEDASLQKIKDRGQLILGTSADYAPYEFHALIDGKDEILGFDIAIAEKIAEHLGVELKIVDMSFEGLLVALNADQVDIVMAGMTPDAERSEAVDFSDIYYVAKQGVLIRTEDSDKYKTIESLEGQKVAAQKGSIQENIVKEQLSKSKLISLTKIPNIVLELKNKTVEAAVMEMPVSEGYVKQYPDLKIAEINVNDDVGGSAIAMKKGSTELVKEVNTVIKQLQEDGSIDKFVVEANEQAIVE